MKVLFPLLGPLLSLSIATADGIRIQKDIPYLGAERAEKMDAYLPAEGAFQGPAPVVVWIHGGGWMTGSKSAKRELNICRTLAEHGYAAFSIDYQLGKEPLTPETAPWPRNVYDCKSAVRYIRKEAAAFGIDPEKIAVSGGSAGGHLALCVGLSAKDAALNKGGLYLDESNDVSCIIDFYGPTTIDAKRAPRFVGKTPEETAANLIAASPLKRLEKDAPPILVAHGTADGTCDIQHSRGLVAKMKELGAVHEYLEVEGAPHSFDFQPKERDLRPAVLEFLAKYLGKPVVK